MSRNNASFSGFKSACMNIMYVMEESFPFQKPSEPFILNMTMGRAIQLVKSCNAALDAQHDEEESNKHSKPMVWIGIYIAIASLLCILAMAADLLHGFRNRKFWFPCKYFSLNAASITVITVAMKLPVDLSGDMPGYIDQATKLGSLAFMCTMMANLMPS